MIGYQNKSIESQLSLDSTRNDLVQLGKPVKFGKILKTRIELIFFLL